MISSTLSNVRYIAGHPLNRGAVFSALSRFFRLQLATRVARTPLVVNWIGPLKFVFSSGESGITQNAYCGLHEHIEMLFVLHVLSKEDLFLDIGANVGSYSLLAAGVCEADVVAIEPVPHTFQKLNRNIRLNDLQRRIESRQIGVAGKPGLIHFTSDQNCTNHMVVGPHHEASEIEVAVETLDQICSDRIPTVIKIDVEGFETEVINGGESTLRSSRLMAVIMEHNESGVRHGYDESRLISHMLQLGIKTATYDPWKREVVDLDGKCLTSGNTLFIRPSSELSARIQRANKIQVHNQLF